VQEKESFSNLKCSNFFQEIFHKSPMLMVWADVGVGKTTLALQFANTGLLDGKKVFYLHTKQTPINSIVNRIMKDIPKELKENLIVWESEKFDHQLDLILQWVLQIQQLREYYNKNMVSVIIIDEIVNLYLAKLGKEEENSKINEKLINILATLAKLIQDYKIPVILLNTFTTKKDEFETFIDSPHGGKIIQYWVDLEIKIERLSRLSWRKFVLVKNSRKINIPQSWAWELSNIGFK
jgi:KaiC/GvpD/RAD55 family RecA-like ATPase